MNMLKIVIFVFIFFTFMDLFIEKAFAEVPLNRDKRANPDSANLTLSSDGVWNTLSVIHISDRIPLRVEISALNGTHNLVVTITTDVINDDNIFSICSSAVVIGANITQPLAEDVNVVYTRLNNVTNVPYKVTGMKLNFSDVTYFDYDDLNGDVYGRLIEIFVDVIVVNSSSFNHGDTYLIHAYADWDNGNEVYTDDEDYTAEWQDSFSITPPLFNLSGPLTVMIGDTSNWTLTMNLRDAMNKIHVESWVNGTYTYPSCYIYSGDIGYNYECLEWSSAATTGIKDRVVFDVPTVINTGFNANETNDADNDITLSILTRVPSYAAVADQLDLNVEIYLDDKLIGFISEPLSLVTGALPAMAGVPVLAIDTVGSVNTVAVGSGLIFSINITTPPGSLSLYDVTLNVDTGLANICDVYLTRIGLNLCMDTNVQISYTSTDSSGVTDEVTVNLGSVPNLFPDALDSDIENEIEFDVVVCVPDQSAVSVGDALSLGVDVTYNAAQTVSDVFPFTLSDGPSPALATNNISFSSPATVPAYIFDTVQFNVTATIIQNTDVFNITIEVPQTRAYVESAVLTFSGSNFVCFDNRTLTESNIFMTSYSQKYKIVYTLGVVSNIDKTGQTLETVGNATGIENTLEFQVQVRVADHILNVQDSLIDVTTTISGVSGIVVSNLDNIQVQITGSEQPVLIMDVYMETFNYYDKISGDNVTFSIQIYHDNASTAHAQDVVVHFMSPYYIELSSIIELSGENITIDSATPELGISFSISEIDPYDFVNLTFTGILDPGRVMPIGWENVETVVPIDMTYRSDVRSDRVDNGIIHSGYVIKQFGFNTAPASALGIETGVIQNCQITATSSLATNPPHKAKLNSNKGWKPNVRGWPFCGEEYLQVNLGTPTLIHGIQLQSSADDNTNIVTSFLLQYSEEGFVWYDVTEENNITPMTFAIDFIPGGSASDVYDVTLDQTVQFTTTYLRLIPKMASCTFGLRLELIGVSKSGPPVDCSTLVSPSSSVNHIQTYVVNSGNGTIFVCGPTTVQETALCSRSDDNGASWTDIDDNIGIVIATISGTSIVIGESRDTITNFISYDDGITWDVVTSEELTELQSDPGYEGYTNLPYEDTRGTSYNDMYSTYGTDADGFQLTGCIEGVAVKETAGAWDTVAWWGTDDWSVL